LHGVRVVEIGQSIAAPFAAALLADLGADVVKVEIPSGDLLRGAGPRQDDVPLWWKATNRNKSLVSLDLRSKPGRAALNELLDPADVLIENLLPGSLKRLGLAVDDLLERHERLVVVSVTGFGQSGPASSRKAFARAVEAFAGLTYSTGSPDGPPIHTGVPLADYVAGLFAALGAVAGMRARDELGATEQHVDVAMFESIVRILEHQVVDYAQLGRVTERVGNRMPTQAGVGVFRAGDGSWISMTGGPHDVMAARMLAMAGVARTEDDLGSAAGRLRQREFIERGLAAWASGSTRAELVEAGIKNDVPVAPVNSMADLAGDEHVLARGSIVRVDDRDLGTVGMPATVPRFSHQQTGVRHAAPLEPEDVRAVTNRWRQGQMPDDKEQDDDA